MLRRALALVIVSLGVACAFLLARPSAPHRTGASSATVAPLGSSTVGIEQKLAQMPLSFEQNAGQTDSSVNFLARANNYTLFLKPTEAVLSAYAPTDRKHPARTALGSAAVRMRFVNANENAKVEGEDNSAGVSNYFMGKDPKTWRTNVPRYKDVRVRGLYDGIDLLYYGKDRELEHDLIVAPGKDPGVIGMSFGDAAELKIDPAGDLVVGLKNGELRLRKPRIYQHEGEKLAAVDGGYVLRGANQIGFSIGKYDPSQPLVIDPVLVFSTYFGGNGGDGVSVVIESVALDASGNIYVAGITSSPSFPLKSPFQGTVPADACGTMAAPAMCLLGFVSKFNPSASALIYSTYFGGTSDEEEADSVAVDANENVYVAGNTIAADFPTTMGAFSTTFVAGTCQESPQFEFPCREAYVAKFDSSGASLDYSTYVGSVGDTAIFGSRSLVVDSSGHAFLNGNTSSTSFPTTPTAFQPTCILAVEDGNLCFKAFVTELNPAGSGLVYSTYLGGSGEDNGGQIALDSTGLAVVAGGAQSTDFPLVNPVQTTPSQGFFAKLKADGSGLVFSSYFGGPQNSNTLIEGIALDQNDDIYLAGLASGPFPTTPGAYLTSIPPTLTGEFGFVSKIDKSGSTVVYSTWLAGPGPGTNEFTSAGALAVDSLGQAYVVGSTSEAEFPQVNPLFPDFVGGTCTGAGQLECTKAFVSVFNATGSLLVFSTYLGGSGVDAAVSMALDPSQSIYVVGQTSSTDFPVVNAFQSTYSGGNCTTAPCSDGFLAKMQIVPVSASPGGLTFSADVGSTSPAQNVTISNASTQAIPVTAVVASTGFSETNTCAAGIPAGGACTVSVSFSPTAAGPATGSLTVTYTAAAGGTVAVPLTGTGTVPTVTVAPTSLQFSSQAIGSPSASQTVTVTNGGNGPLVFSNIATTGDFSQTNTCTPSVPANSACTIAVVFTPVASGARSGQLTITDNVGSSPQMVPLTGTGSGPVATLSPGSLQFNSQVVGTISAAQPVTLMNSGTSSFTIASISASGDFGETNTCGASLAAAASCSLSVTFSPTGIGSRTGSVTVTDSAFGSPHVVALSGTGVGFSLAPPAGAPTMMTVAAGQSAVFNLQAQGTAGFTGNVGLAANCGSVPLNTSCALSAPSVQINGATAVPFTLTVGTTMKSWVVPFSPRGGRPTGGAKYLVSVGAFGFALTLLLVSRRWNGWRLAAPRVALGFGLALLGISVVSCGGSGGSGGGGSPGTTPGTYTVTVTASAQGASQTQTLTVVVTP